jgi:hypothetical protein
MFAKSKQIGLVSLFVLLGATIGGCAESVGNEPASFPSQSRPVAFINRQLPTSELLDERMASEKVEAAATPSAWNDAKRPASRPLAAAR